MRAGLTAAPKHLQPKYFYDETGSALFDAITVMPEYYLTRAETEILREWGWEIVRALGNPLEFIELGSGSAVKTRIVIEEALRAQGSVRYCPIDISQEALRASAQSLVEAYPNLSVCAYAGDYFSVLGTPLLERPERVMVMFMGSNIGNYEPADARALVAGIARTLKPGDGLLMGMDLRKDARTLVSAYSDAAGVTAAFNKNLLSRINRELGGNFDARRFSHVARYDEQLGRVGSYLEAADAHAVRVEELNLEISFAAGEAIHTESAYKFTMEQIAELGRAAGLRLARTWKDRSAAFTVNLFVKP